MTFYDQLTERDLLLSAWQTLRRIESAIGARIEVPAPQVTVTPPDLTAIVTAVEGLNGTPGPTAEDIARAIADVLVPARADDSSDALRQVAEGLKMLDHRMQGMGKQAYGGGSVSFSDAGYRQMAEAVQTTTSTTVVAYQAAIATVVELGSNRPTRSAMTVYNEPSSSVLYLKFGAGASLTDYSNRLGPGDYWESSPPKYTGLVTALWDGTTGGARVSEFMP